MARKKAAPEPENHERWLVSYADFITLLFAFFVVMFATSQTDKNKAKAVEDSVKKALAEGEHKSFNHQKIQELASRFSAKNFRQNANQVIKQLIKMGKKETTNG